MIKFRAAIYSYLMISYNIKSCICLYELPYFLFIKNAQLYVCLYELAFFVFIFFI